MPNKISQFSLRSLFTLTATVALFAAQCQAFQWKGQVIVDAAMLSVAVLLISNGLFARSRTLISLGGVLFVVAVFCWSITLTMVAVSDGERVCPVIVEVYDQASGKPIASANVWFGYDESPPAPHGKYGPDRLCRPCDD